MMDLANQDSKLSLNILTFINMLRENDIRISTAEVTDAFNALTNINIADRPSFKAAMKATLVKNRQDNDQFDVIFDAFFIPYKRHKENDKEYQLTRKRISKKLENASSEIQFMGESLKLTGEELSQYSYLTADNRKRLQEFIHKTETGKNVKPQFKPLLETVVKSHLRYCRDNARVKKAGNDSDAATGAGFSSPANGKELRKIDIQNIAESDIYVADDLLRSLSNRLAVRIIRSRRAGLLKNQIDFRRSVRENMRFGGTMFHLKYKPKHNFKQQVLLLCDVSASMKMYSSFVIKFMSGLKEVINELSCFIFSDKLENIDSILAHRKSLKEVTSRIIRDAETWGGGTNIANSLKALNEEYNHLMKKKSTIIIVSDTRSVLLDDTVLMLSKIKNDVRKILWLNPLPLECWNRYQSIKMISDLVEMWPCNTIAQLEKALSSQLKIN